MPITVTLTGSRHTDGTEGRLSLLPRTQWLVTSGSVTTAPGPLYFKITAAGAVNFGIGKILWMNLFFHVSTIHQAS